MSEFPGGPGPATAVPDAADPDPLTPLFAPPTASWIPLSPRYRELKHRLVLLVWGLWMVLAAAAAQFLTGRWWATALVVVVFAAWIGYRYQRVDRVYRVWGYAERDTDLYVRSGLLFRRLVAVPYGRMQVVEVESGPIERHFGLASVKLVTASASTDARIPGLDAAAAATLRDRLTDKGETQVAGL
ncbi:MAG: PH domain-containing protein [Propionibacterium sp.]|nr:PH domain-containing protein [Propionibacterium sp.]